MFVAKKGNYDLEAHANNVKHKKEIQTYRNTSKDSELFTTQN
jgi:hypothetical protein